MTTVRRLRVAAERAILGLIMNGVLVAAERLLTAEHERARAERQARQHADSAGERSSRRPHISLGRRT
jgi:hypothetical protein